MTVWVMQLEESGHILPAVVPEIEHPLFQGFRSQNNCALLLQCVCQGVHYSSLQAEGWLVSTCIDVLVCPGCFHEATQFLQGRRHIWGKRPPSVCMGCMWGRMSLSAAEATGGAFLGRISVLGADPPRTACRNGWQMGFAHCPRLQHQRTLMAGPLPQKAWLP